MGKRQRSKRIASGSGLKHSHCLKRQRGCFVNGSEDVEQGNQTRKQIDPGKPGRGLQMRCPRCGRGFIYLKDEGTFFECECGKQMDKEEAKTMNQDEAMMSKTIAQLVEALAKAQGEMKAAKKGSENPFFKSTYADLAAVCEASMVYLSKNGLAIIQTLDEMPSNFINGRKLVVYTTLAHTSGEWIRSRLVLIPTADTPQGIGSAITYGRRYSHMAIIGLPAEDDDAEGAMGRGKKEPQRKKQGSRGSGQGQESGKGSRPGIKCPKCGVEAIIPNKEEYGGGLFCYKNKGGCGEKFPDKAAIQKYGAEPKDQGQGKKKEAKDQGKKKDQPIAIHCENKGGEVKTKICDKCKDRKGCPSWEEIDKKAS